MSEVIHPCSRCPWRVENQGKRTAWGFYTKRNLRRLWAGIRDAKGGTAQSCHPTDPSHPDHIASGTKPDAKPSECAGSVVLVLREFRALQNAAEGDTIGPQHIDSYLKNRPLGLTRRGLRHWLIGRYQFGGVPIVGTGSALPKVDIDEPGLSRPESPDSPDF